MEKIESNFKKFCKCIRDNKDIIDTGKLAEKYCVFLFDLKRKIPQNGKYDAETKDKKKIEIKYRNTKGLTPPGMKLKFKKLDYVYYVELNDDLLPKQILQFNRTWKPTTGSRVSFFHAMKNKNYEVIYSNDGRE